MPSSEFAHLTLQPRTRLLVAVLLAMGAAAVRDLAMLPVLAVLVVAVILLVRPPLGLVRKLRAPFALALAFVVIIPVFGTGPALWQVGPITFAQDAAAAAIVIAVRLLAIAAMVLALLSGLSDMQLVSALRGSRVPPVICDLALLTLRYLHDLRAELARARLARRLRGGADGWRSLPDFGALLAVLLIRTLRQSERVWMAMRLRGYHNAVSVVPAPYAVGDLLAVAGAALAALVLIGVRV